MRVHGLTRGSVVLLSLLVLSLIPWGFSAPADEHYPICRGPAGEVGEWKLTYEASFNGGSDKVEVVIRLDDPEGEVESISVRDLRSVGTSLTNFHTENSWIGRNSWVTRGAETATISYTISEYTSHTSSNWLITTGDYLFLIGSSWTGTSTSPRVQVKVMAPEGWEIYTPYRELAPGEFDATGMIRLLPEDFIIIGVPDSIKAVKGEEAGKDFTVLAIDAMGVDVQQVLDYLVDLSPVYSQLAGCTPPAVLAAIIPNSSGIGLFGGGYGYKDASFLISGEDPFPLDLSPEAGIYAHRSIYASQLFRLYQIYYATFQEGTGWLGKGAVNYYRFYGPLRVGYLTAEEFWNVLVEVIANQIDKSVLLAQRGTYIRNTTQIHLKGSLVIMALDIKIRQDTDGQFSFDDVFRELNIKFIGERKYAFRVTEDMVREIIASLTGDDYADFFAEYVQGTGFPDEIFASAGPELYEGLGPITDP